MDKVKINSLLDYLKDQGLVFDEDQALRSCETDQQFRELFRKYSSLSMQHALHGPVKDLIKQVNGNPWLKAIAMWRMQH